MLNLYFENLLHVNPAGGDIALIRIANKPEEESSATGSKSCGQGHDLESFTVFDVQ